MSEELLQLKIKELEAVLNNKSELLFLLNDSVPVGDTLRKKYVADVALFYSSIFKDKLKHFIGLQMMELSQIGRTELSTNILRANINCFRVIDEWMQQMSNEHVAYIENERQKNY